MSLSISLFILRNIIERIMMLAPDEVFDFPLFQNFSAGDLKNLFEKITLENHPKGEDIFEEGTRTDKLFITYKGKIGIFSSKGETEVTLTGGGSIIAEMAFFDFRGHSATVRAESEVEIFSIPRKDWDGLTKEHPEVVLKLVLKILGILSLRLRGTKENLKDYIKAVDQYFTVKKDK